MEDQTDIIEEPKPKKSRTFEYKNTSVFNVFTEAGRCRPGKTVRLTVAQAKKHELLERVK